jgi:5'(3')-deoxyribonucleotidase
MRNHFYLKLDFVFLACDENENWQRFYVPFVDCQSTVGFCGRNGSVSIFVS